MTTEAAPPEHVIALARSLYFKDDGKEQRKDWRDVANRLRQIRDRFRGGTALAQNFIDDFFMTEIGAQPNADSGGYAVFSFDAAIESAIKQAEWMAEADESLMAGQRDASEVLLDWFAANVGVVKAGGSDRNGEPANEDGSGLPIVLSAAEKWLLERLKEIDPDVSARAAQSRVSYYLKRKA